MLPFPALSSAIRPSAEAAGDCAASVLAPLPGMSHTSSRCCPPVGGSSARQTSRSTRFSCWAEYSTAEPSASQEGDRSWPGLTVNRAGGPGSNGCSPVWGLAKGSVWLQASAMTTGPKRPSAVHLAGVTDERGGIRGLERGRDRGGTSQPGRTAQECSIPGFSHPASEHRRGRWHCRRRNQVTATHVLGQNGRNGTELPYGTRW